MAEHKETSGIDHSGHRQRMKDRYLANGLSGFSSHEIMELLLYYAVPYRDVNGLAHRLVEEFGGLTNLLEADYTDLLAHEGVTPHMALLICLCRDIGRRYHEELAGRVTQLCDTADYVRYLVPQLVGLRQETVLLLSLDNKRKLLNISRIQEGSTNILTLNKRLAVRQALTDNATAVVLAHNHPSGFAFPSKEDIEITQQMADLLLQVDITLLDHVLVAENDCLSMAELYKSTGEFHVDIHRVNTVD